jgi:hypothetical protein
VRALQFVFEHVERSRIENQSKESGDKAAVSPSSSVANSPGWAYEQPATASTWRPSARRAGRTVGNVVSIASEIRDGVIFASEFKEKT